MKMKGEKEVQNWIREKEREKETDKEWGKEKKRIENKKCWKTVCS